MREYSLSPSRNLRSSLTDEQLQRLVAAGKHRRLAHGDSLYRQGERADHIMVLLRGMVKATSVNAVGQETVLRVHLPGSLVGLTAIGAALRRDATATAMEDCEVVILTRRCILHFMRTDGELGTHIARLLQERLESFQFRVHEFLASRVRQRVARVLLDFSVPVPIDVHGKPRLHLSHEELSQIVSARRPTVTQALRAFAVAGLVRLERRCIVVLDMERLEAVALTAASPEREPVLSSG